MIRNLNKYVDHTILKPFATEEDVKKLCADERVDEDYVRDFAAQTVVQRDAFYKNLGK